MLFLTSFGPSILGATLCAILWWGLGLDNIGILLLVGGIVYNFWGWEKSPVYETLDRWFDAYSRLGGNGGGPSDQMGMRGKIARYDKDGKITGYQDRE